MIGEKRGRPGMFGSEQTGELGFWGLRDDRKTAVHGGEEAALGVKVGDPHSHGRAHRDEAPHVERQRHASEAELAQEDEDGRAGRGGGGEGLRGEGDVAVADEVADDAAEADRDARGCANERMQAARESAGRTVDGGSAERDGVDAVAHGAAVVLEQHQALQLVHVQEAVVVHVDQLEELRSRGFRHAGQLSFDVRGQRLAYALVEFLLLAGSNELRPADPLQFRAW
eukprot:2358866-Rhodomonas_salina.1